MPLDLVRRHGYEDGLVGRKRQPFGYPHEYEHEYVRGYLEVRPLRRRVKALGLWLIRKAEGK